MNRPPSFRNADCRNVEGANHVGPIRRRVGLDRSHVKGIVEVGHDVHAVPSDAHALGQAQIHLIDAVAKVRVVGRINQGHSDCAARRRDRPTQRDARCGI